MMDILNSARKLTVFKILDTKTTMCEPCMVSGHAVRCNYISLYL